MQTLSHKIIYNLYKSCSALHKRTGKIGFTFFWLICEFLQILQVTGKTQRKGRILLHTGPYKLLTLHNHSLELAILTDRSSAAKGRSPPAMWARSGPTNGTPVQLGSPSVGLWVWMRRGAVRRGGSARTDGGGRWKLISGEPTGGTGQHAKLEALGGPIEEVWRDGRLREQPVHGAHREGQRRRRWLRWTKLRHGEGLR
jgi:hypothetical protein